MRVALYVRVSTEEQAEEGFSIEAQIEYLKEHCERNKWDIVAIYKDEGVSAASLARPELQRLLSDSASNAFEKILFWKVSRLSRRLYDFLKLEELLGKHNVGLLSVSEGIDPSTPTGRVMVQMMGAFAELERNQIVENVKLGMTQRAREGKWNGGAVLGYQSQGKMLKIIDDEANIVRLIFSLYVDGYGYKAITNRLNHSGYKTKKGKEFSITSVRNILKNPLYAGYIRFNSVVNWAEKRRSGRNDKPVVVLGDHTPIIEMELWQKAQSIMANKSDISPKTFTGAFPLSGLLRCPQCGQGMIGHKNKAKKGSTYIRYYICGNFHRKGSAVCKSNSVRADNIETEVFERIEQLLSNDSFLEATINEVNHKLKLQKQPLMDNLEYIENQIELVSTNANKYLTLFESGQLQPEFLTARLQSLQEELANLKLQKQQVQSLVTSPIKEISKTEIQLALTFFSELLPKASSEKQKAVLHSFIRQITVHVADDINERNAKDVELYFDIADNTQTERVLTYDTVPRAQFGCLDRFAPAGRPAPVDAAT